MKDWPLKLVIDTNTIFMNFYNPEGNAAKIINLAERGKLLLFSPDTVKLEIYRVLKREMNLEDWLIYNRVEDLPINWIDYEAYKHLIKKTEVKHKPDKPVEAVALLLNCEILSADHHFKKRANIDKILQKIGD